jgi:hypothetical protein
MVNLRFGRRSWVDLGVEIGSEVGRLGVLRDGSGGQEIPERVDNDISKKITKNIRS